MIFFGFFLGLATLAKGPAAIVLSGGGVLLWAALTRRWRDAFRCLHPVAIASFCLTALPWYIICSRRNPDFFRIFIIEHNFKRYLTPEFQHIQPFWFYVPVLLVAFAPWTLALVWSALFGALRAWPQRRPSDATLLALCWVRLLPRILLHLQIQAPRLHPPRRPTHRPASGQFMCPPDA